MRPHLSFLLPIVALLAGGSPARADDFKEPGGVNTCELRAWSTDPDPNGLNIRSGPGTEYPVIGNLPAPLEVEGEKFATEMSITGSKDGWIRIDRGEVVDYIWSEQDAVVFEGEGWVSGRYVGFNLESYELYGKPSAKSEPMIVFGEIEPESGWTGPEWFVLERLHGCYGNWIDVEGSYLGTHVRGWTIGACPNQVTTCGGGWYPIPDDRGL